MPVILQVLGAVCQRAMGAFSVRRCNYCVERHREATARVAVWRQYRVSASYTLEASVCGADEGIYQVCRQLHKAVYSCYTRDDKGV